MPIRRLPPSPPFAAAKKPALAPGGEPRYRHAALASGAKEV